MTLLYKAKVAIRAYVAQLFAHILRLFGHLVFGEAVAPSAGTKSVSAKWLTRLLHQDGTLDKSITVSSVEIEGLSGNRSLVGAMNRLVVSYSAETSAPSTFILKMSRDGVNNRRGVIASGQFREGLFYESKLSSSASSVLPRIYYSFGSSILGEYVILMEDLKREGTIGANLLFGNQIWGVPPLEFDADPVLLLDTIFKRAADFHAQHWNDRSLLSQKWLKSVDWYNGNNRIQWDLAISSARRGWEMIKKKDVKLDADLSSIIDASFAQSSWSVLQKHLHNPSVPFTLCHGDFHAANMSVQRLRSEGEFFDNHRIFLYDWSEIGVWEPTTDLAQTLISDVKSHIFTEHSHALVKTYWQRLIDNGVSAEEYPFETCWEAFCRGGAERWIWIFSILGSFPSIPDVAVQYFHDQLLAFVMAFGAGNTFFHLQPVVCVA